MAYTGTVSAVYLKEGKKTWSGASLFKLTGTEDTAEYELLLEQRREYEDWDVIYDKVIRAGKSLWLKVYSGGVEDWIRNMERIVKRYGSARLFFFLPEMSYEQAVTLIEYAEKNWSDVEGSFTAQLHK